MVYLRNMFFIIITIAAFNTRVYADDEAFCDQFSGKLGGLCQAFCVATNCDSVDAKASSTACLNIQNKIAPLLADYNQQHGTDLEIKMATGTTPGACGQVQEGFILTATLNGNQVDLTWGASPGALFYTVERTYENPTDPFASWQQLTDTPGTSYTDESPYPGSAHYRVIAQNSDSSTTTSNVVTVTIN